ncbi:hypothetical protein I4U23_024106 [Adineta vaga]|nr:hypothetical protein I4U23_024106 [Adineta vaga]
MLDNAKKQRLVEINSWEKETIRQIQKYTSKQSSLLQNEYDSQLHIWKSRRQAFHKILDVHEQNRNISQISELLNQCRSLKFELSAIGYSDQNIPFILLRYNNAATNVNQNETSSYRNEVARSQTEHRYENNAKNYTGSTFANVQQTNLLTRTTTNENIDGYCDSRCDNTYCDVNDNDESMDKCPTCYMIYPLHMTKTQRLEHFTEHFNNT